MKSCQITHKKPYHLDTSNNLAECYYSYTVVGRSFFSTRLGPKGVLPEGLEYWRGYYQSLRPTQMGLSLNIGTSSIFFFIGDR